MKAAKRSPPRRRRAAARQVDVVVAVVDAQAVRAAALALSRPTRASRSRRAPAARLARRQRGGRAGRGGGRGDNASVELASANPNDPYAKMRPLARPPQGSITKPLNPARFDGRHFIDERTRSNDAGFLPSTGRGGRGAAADDSTLAPAAAVAVVAVRSCRRPAPRPVQLFIQRGGGERKQITNTNYTHVAPSVSPDGKWVVVQRRRASCAPTRSSRASATRSPSCRTIARATKPIATTPISTSCPSPNAKPATPLHASRRRSSISAARSNIIWSADSKQFAFVGRPGQFSSSRLMLASVDGGKAVDLLGTWKYEPGQIEWFKDGKIRMTTTTGGASRSVAGRSRHEADLADPRRTPRRCAASSWTRRRRSWSTRRRDVSHLAEYYVSDINGTE